MTNHHGLDVDYFRRKLLHLVRDLEQQTPSDFDRACARLSSQAEYARPAPAPDDQDLQEER